MCRLFALQSLVPVSAAYWLLEAPHALIQQSHCDSRGQANRDGWGIACYTGDAARPSSPEVHRGSGAAYSDPEFAARAAAAGRIVLAHVRNASVGRVSQVNCHPFVFGSWAFAHNGNVPEFRRLEGRLLDELAPEYWAARRGETDSECLFLWLLHGWRQAGGGTLGDAEAWAAYLTEAFSRLERFCPPAQAENLKLTFVASDGVGLLAVRWGNSLYWANAAQVWQAGPQASGPCPEGVVVASEAITAGGWQELSERSMLTVNAELQVRLLRLPGRRGSVEGR